MKKLKSMLVTLAMLLCAITANAEEVVEINGLWYNLIAKAGIAEITRPTDGTRYSGDVVIPASVTYNNKTYSVTSIGNSAFGYCNSLNSISIPNSVTSIGDYAFGDCHTIVSLTLPNSVTTIGNEAFFGCRKLTSINIPNSVTSIGKKAFGECTSLNSVIIPNSVTSIGNEIFYQCTTLTSISIPNSITSISDRAFGECYRLTSVSIPNSVTSIGEAAFENCSSLTSIALPNSLTNIGGSAFSGCKALTSVTIPNSVTDIGGFAFSGCKSLVSVNIPDGITMITWNCFENCSSLTSISIPNSVYLISDWAFKNCSSLTSIYIPNSVAFIGEAFIGCKKLTTVTIPESVKDIGKNAFAQCENIEDVFCFAEKLPKTETSAFDKSYPEYATLHVPAVAISKYKSTAPWSSFGKIVALSDGDEPVVPEPEKCATPTISYINGELVFESETEGVVFHSTITDTDINSYDTNKVQLNVTYNISVYATKEGYKDSEVAKATLCWIDVEPKSEGLTDTDIANVKALPVVVQASNGTITVTGADDGTMVEVYGISGTKLGEAKTAFNTATISIAQHADNVVIVKVGNKSIKIAL